jgi:HPt (histidine-containing phosphotransfer) domain-containing protein
VAAAGTDGPRQTSGTPAVDAATLAGLRDLGDDQLRTLIPLFIEDSAKRVGGLRRRLGDGGLGGLAPIAHTLKGSCSSFGAHVLAGLCSDLERLARAAGDRGEAIDLVRALETEFDRVRDALLSELDRVGSAAT